jgi:DNA-binding NarL/FixJ family response regulator
MIEARQEQPQPIRLATPAAPAVPATKVIVAAKIALYGTGIRSVLDAQPDLKVCAVVRTLDDLCARAAELEPDLIIVDEDVFERQARHIRTLYTSDPGVGIIAVIAQETKELCMNIVSAGVVGIIHRTDSEQQMLNCVNTVANGGYGISDRVFSWFIKYHQDHPKPVAELAKSDPRSEFREKEIQIVTMMAQGMRYRAIANRLQTTDQCIRNELARLKKRLKIEGGKEEILQYCADKGIIQLPR